MYLEIIPKIAELGGVVVIAILAIFCLFWIIKNKKGENNEIKELLTSIKGNHLGTIDTKIDFLTKQTADNEEKLNKIIEILGDIKEKINYKVSGGKVQKLHKDVERDVFLGYR